MDECIMKDLLIICIILWLMVGVLNIFIYIMFYFVGGKKVVLFWILKEFMNMFY